MSERPASRLDGARRRAAAVKRALAVGSLAAFGVAALWAHASHPGDSAVQSNDNGAVTLDDRSDQSFGFGSGALAPSDGVAPDTSTHVS